MPPFSPQNISLAQNGTSNSSVPIDETCTDDISAHHVSWQSAYWPVMACMLAVLLQETGRVLNAPYRISYALRACLAICGLDTCMMIAKFIVLLAIGCGPLDAARHVWYDRFDRNDNDPVWLAAFGFLRKEPPISTSDGGALEPIRTALPRNGVNSTGNDHLNEDAVSISSDDSIRHSGSPSTIWNPSTTMFVIQPSHNAVPSGLPSRHDTVDSTSATAAVLPLRPNVFESPPDYMIDLPGTTVDRTWRLSMVSFIFGALPQTIKIFSMRGIPFTQFAVGTLIVSFVVPEIFRLLAGPVGKYNLRPLPIVLRVKDRFRSSLVFIFMELLFGMYWLSATGIIAASTLNDEKGLLATSRLFVFNIPVHAVIALFITLPVLRLLRCIASSKIWVRQANKTWVRPTVAHLKHAFMFVVSRLFGVSMISVESHFAFALVYSLCLVGTTGTFWWPTSSKSGWGDWRLVRIAVVVTAMYGVIILPLLVPMGFYVLHRILFVGFLSTFLRHLCGANGSMDEFFTGTFILMNLGCALFAYANAWHVRMVNEWGPQTDDTHKPSWAEYLG